MNDRSIDAERKLIIARDVGRDPMRVRNCMLLVTHNCNLKCTYCYEKHKSNKMMTFEVARKIMESELALVRDDENFDWLLVDLFGGEPLLNFALIRQIVEWTRKHAQGIRVLFMISSNGTLLNDEMKEWLIHNKDIVRMGLSYDGSEESQLRNRGKANWDALQFCKKLWPENPFHLTVSPEMLPRLAKDILTSANQGFLVDAELAGGVEWMPGLHLVFMEQLRRLKDAYLKDETIRRTFMDRFFRGGEDSEGVDVVACGSGTRCICYDAEAQTYPCQMFAPITVGSKAIPLQNFSLKEQKKCNDPSCNGCPIHNWCPTCYGMNYFARGQTALRDHGMCAMYLAQALVTIEFQSELIMQKTLNSESASLLKFLLRIYQKIESALQKYPAH